MEGKRDWSALTTAEAARLPAGTVAILPIAATEQHGPHLPLSTDTDIATGILARALALLPDDVPALALPMLAVGHSPEHSAFPGTLTLRAETLLRLLAELAEGVAAAGVRRLLLFTSHGGNPPVLDLSAVDLRVRLGLFVVPVHYERFGLPDGLFDERERRWGIHGGAVETSLMLHLRPDRVHPSAFADFPSRAEEVAAANTHLRLHRAGWMAQDLNPAGVVGDPRAATAEKGRAVLEHTARGLAALIAEVAAHPLPADGG